MFCSLWPQCYGSSTATLTREMATIVTDDQSEREGATNQVGDLATWLTRQGLEGTGQEQILESYCNKLVEIGLPVHRVHVAQRALHPVYGGIGFDWQHDTGVSREHYERVTEPRAQWVRSPLYYLLKTGLPELRRRLPADGDPSDFPFLDDLRTKGARDYFASVVQFGEAVPNAPADPDNPPEGMIISWASFSPEGFSDRHITILRELLPVLGLALKAAANRQIANELLAIYLGPDAGARVLSGKIQRGSLETINAAILYFDLQGFTKLTEAQTGETVTEMLNDYFGAVVAIIEDHGGNVLKFMGDGLLSIFSTGDNLQACTSAVAAAADIRAKMAEINGRRAGGGTCWTGFSLAVHHGNVHYGNIGADNRLDFTIIGRAVNLASRIQGMCRALERDVIISAPVAEAAAQQRSDVYSLGSYMLRGVREPQELFTLAPSSDDCLQLA